MSIKVMSQVWERSNQKLGSLLLMLAIADHADDEGVAYPTIARLAEKTRMTERNVQLLLKQLSASGELALRPGEGPHGCHIYEIAMHEACRCQHGGENISPENCSGVKNFRGEKSDTPGVKNPVKNAAPLLPPPSPVPSPLISPPVPDPSVEPSGGARARAHQVPPLTPKRAHRCPADYHPGDGVRAWAAERFPAVDVDEALDAMRDYEFRTPHSDWDATLRTWIRREGKQVPARASPGPRRLTRDEQRAIADARSNQQLEDLVLGRDTHNSVWAPVERHGQNFQPDPRPRREGRLLDGRG